MKRITTCTLIFTMFLLAFSSCSNNKLSEDKAKKTVETLLARGAELPDNSPRPAQLIEWRGLLQVSEMEMNGNAVIQHKDGRMTGQFIFHKNSEGKWILNKVKFNTERGGGYWHQDVYQAVE